MKRIVLNIITAVVFCFGATAQNVNIPDANFKSFLVGNTAINTNMDSEIQVSEANAFSGIILCSFMDITDLTGIEAFTNLTFLHCNDNSLTTLDLSQNTALQNLNCSNNNISTLDVSQNVNLTYLQGKNNNLTSVDLSQSTALVNVQLSQNDLSIIDVSQNIALSDLSLTHNNLNSIDVSQNTALTSLGLTYNNLNTLDVSLNTALLTLQCNHNNLVNLDVSQNTDLTDLYCGNNDLISLKLKNLSSSTMNAVNALDNSNLTCIQVDDVAAATANISFLYMDNWASFSTSCSPIVNIPDANFKAYLVGNSAINTNMDSEIQVSEANAFSGAINCYGDNIDDLTGIEAFTAITELNCDENNLTTLDVSQNTALTKLSCSENNLTALDISQNTALEILWFEDNNLSVIDISQHSDLTSLLCEKNDLTVLDVSQNTALIDLTCGRNNLTELNLNQNLALLYLYCRENNLTTLDLSYTVNLEALDCRDNNLTALNVKNISPSVLSPFKAENNPNLTCIEVDDVAAATAAWTNIDPQTSFSETCGVIPVTSISVQGQGGASTISTLAGTLQMEANVLPMNATDNTYTWGIINLTGTADIDANGLVTAITDGTVKVTVTANDGSGVNGSENITISNQSSNISEQNILSNISIYPNPANSQIIIDAEAEIEAITILDIMGKTVKTMVEPNHTVNISDLPKGIYFVQIQIENTLVSKKIIKE